MPLLIPPLDGLVDKERGDIQFLDDDGDIYYDYTNLPVGKMLAREMMEDASTDEIDVDWDYEFEDLEDGEDWQDG